MSIIYYTTVENLVVDDDDKCREKLYYIEGMIPNINVAEWKRKQQNTTCVFVPLFPDHEELEVGALYLLKYFGDA
jgi:hypothetical protein